VVSAHDTFENLYLKRLTGLANVPQHLPVIGYRGMGKTTLLRRIALAVADDSKLAADWIPLTFPKEQYTVSTLAELWMNVLDAQADCLERQGATLDQLAGLDAGIQEIEVLPPAEREDAAQALLRDWTARRQRRLLLLIDGSDLLLANLGQIKGRRGRVADAEATPLWRLRKTLSHTTPPSSGSAPATRPWRPTTNTRMPSMISSSSSNCDP